MVLGANALIDPNPGLMIWTVVCFAIAFFVLRKYAFGPIQGVIDERRRRILEAIEEADRSREEARGLLEEHRALLGRARADAEEILAEGRKVAEAQRERMKDELESERQRRIQETSRQIEAETRRALEQIRAEIAELALLATAKVTGKALDEKDHRRLIDEAISELDFSLLEKEGAGR
jgi:F-type H+-transporting ATPase subunit b